MAGFLALPGPFPGWETVYSGEKKGGFSRSFPFRSNLPAKSVKLPHQPVVHLWYTVGTPVGTPLLYTYGGMVGRHIPRCGKVAYTQVVYTQGVYQGGIYQGGIYQGIQE